MSLIFFYFDSSFSLCTSVVLNVLNSRSCSLPPRTPSAYQASRCELLTQITETAETLQWLAHVEVLNQYIQIMFNGYYSGNEISIRIINNTENGSTTVQPLLHRIILLTGNRTYDLLLKWRMRDVYMCLCLSCSNCILLTDLHKSKGWKKVIFVVLHALFYMHEVQEDLHLFFMFKH